MTQEEQLKAKKKKILEEKKRLTELFVGTDKNTLSAAMGLIDRAAYLRVSLQEYEEDINQNGVTEKFTQSTRTAPYDKERPIVKIYTNLGKNYQSTIALLNRMLPKGKLIESADDDDLDDFINNRE